MSARAIRLPKIDAALVLLATGLEVERDRLGMAHCRDTTIGAQRKKLGPAPAVLEYAHLPDTEVARDRARQLLAGMCDVCPFSACEMKRWGMD